MTDHSFFDDQVKKDLGQYAPEVPSHVWENIERRKEKKRPAGFLFTLGGKSLLLALIAIFAAGTGYWFYRSKTPASVPKISSIHPVSSPNPNQSSNATGLSHETPTITKEAEQSSSSGRRIELAPAKNELTTNAAITQTQGTPGDAFPTAEQRSLQPVLESASSAAADMAAAPTSKNQRPIYSPSAQKVRARDRNKRSLNSPAAFGVNSESPGMSEEDLESAVGNATIESSAPGMANRYLVLQTLQLKPGLPGIKENNLQMKDIPCPRGNTAGNSSYFEIYGGPDYAFRSFNDTANSVYLQKRKESTRFASAFSAGFRYTRVFNNAFSFRTGLNYSQVNEKFRFEQGHIIQLVYTIDENNDTTGAYATMGSRYKTTHNKYRTIDVPLLLGYEFSSGKFASNINAGLVVNAYSWQKGDILDSAFQPVNITTGKSNSPYQFKTNVGLGFTAGASFYYQLRPRMYLMAEPYMRYNFSAANKADITLKQKYTTAGLRLGLRFNF